MFFFIRNSKYIPLGYIKCSNVTSADEMFKNCQSITSLPKIENWNLDEKTSMKSMFEECTSLTTLPIFNKSFFKKKGTYREFFKGCISLSYIPIELLKTDDNYYNYKFSSDCINTFKDEYLYDKNKNKDKKNNVNDGDNIINEDDND